MTLPGPRSQWIQQLSRQIQQIERSRQEKVDRAAFELGDSERRPEGAKLADPTRVGWQSAAAASSSSRGPCWDSWLKNALSPGGLSGGTIVEWLAPPGAGASTLALKLVAPLLVPRTQQVQGPAAQQTESNSARSGLLVVVDRQREFYPPGLQMEIPLDRILVVRPLNKNDTLWAVEQALRCPGVIATFCSMEELTDRVFRRLQLASESGGGIGLFLRSIRFQTHPSWASSRFLVQPQAAQGGVAGRRVRVELLYGRGRVSGQGVELEIDDETGRVSVVSQLGSATNLPRAAGA